MRERKRHRQMPVATPVAVAIGLAVITGCGRSGPTPAPTAPPPSSTAVVVDSPAGAAVAWAKAVFAGDRPAQQAKTCPGSADGNATAMKLITADVTGVAAGLTTGGGNSFSVTLELTGVNGVQEFSVHVARISGSYYIC